MKKIIINSLLAICLLVFTLLISTIVVTKMKGIYYYSIDKYNLVDNSIYTEKVMKENYSYVIDFLFNDEGEFKLPSMKYSEDGAFHFMEVKKLYNLASNAIVYLTVIIIILIYVHYKKFKDYIFLKISGLAVILAPIVTILIVSTNFDKYFTIFHKIFFDNDKWLFDPSVDPIINVLPEEFFALCGAAIVGGTIFIGILMVTSYLVIKKLRKPSV